MVITVQKADGIVIISFEYIKGITFFWTISLVLRTNCWKCLCFTFLIDFDFFIVWNVYISLHTGVNFLKFSSYSNAFLSMLSFVCCNTGERCIVSGIHRKILQLGLKNYLLQKEKNKKSLVIAIQIQGKHKKHQQL